MMKPLTTKKMSTPVSPTGNAIARVGIVHLGELVAGMERHHQHGGEGAQILKGNDHERSLGQPEISLRLAALH